MLILNKNGIRNHLRTEILKLTPNGLFSDAVKLCPSLRKSDLSSETKSGIRAQLVDLKNHELVHDFIIAKDAKSTHVLNAVSPAFTASFAIAENVVKEITQNLTKR